MPEYVMVPVPQDLVASVMKFITDQTDAAPETPSVTLVRDSDLDSADPETTEESRRWTRAELEVLADGEAKSVKLFAEMLDILAEASPNAVPLERVAEHTGVPPLKMQNAFGRVTVWIQNRMGGDKRWPIYWPGDGWAMGETNASLWKEIRS